MCCMSTQSNYCSFLAVNSLGSDRACHWLENVCTCRIRIHDWCINSEAQPLSHYNYYTYLLIIFAFLRSSSLAQFILGSGHSGDIFN